MRFRRLLLKFLLTVILGFSMVSCFYKVSLKVELPDDPDVFVEYISIVKHLDRDSDFTKKIENEKVLNTDPEIFAVIKVFNISKKIDLKWKWFDPEKKLVRVSEPVAVNRKNGFLEYFVAWDSLDNELFAGKKGEWTVAVIVDDEYLTCCSFSVN